MGEQMALGDFMEDNRPARTKPDKQGRQANTTGNAAEAAIVGVLHSKGIVFMRQQKIGKGLYRSDVKVDFYISPCKRLPKGLIIESKWQQSGGSVDEKYPYLVENIKRYYPSPCIVVVDGGGYKPGAVEFLRNQVDGVRLIAVQTISEFLTWSNRNL